jgi:hypothetical protein
MARARRTSQARLRTKQVYSLSTFGSESPDECSLILVSAISDFFLMHIVDSSAVFLSGRPAGHRSEIDRV